MKCLKDGKELTFIPAHKDPNMHVRHGDVFACPRCGKVYTKEDLGIMI